MGIDVVHLGGGEAGIAEGLFDGLDRSVSVRG